VSAVQYTATVEVRPRVEPKDYEGLSVTRIDARFTDAQVDERIEEMRANQAMFVPIEGRDVAEAGDFVSADYEGFVEGAPLRGAKREGVLLEVAPGSLLENKAEGLWERGWRESRARRVLANTMRWRNCAARKRVSR